ncbi:hypothetical protein GCM10025331_10690 [Actinoplanes utahensis]|nr:hypothetical protein Aut01nite_17930 [Actinoplanes utahensis]
MATAVLPAAKVCLAKRRWVAEHTLSRLMQHRRLVRDYLIEETTPSWRDT